MAAGPSRGKGEAGRRWGGSESQPLLLRQEQPRERSPEPAPHLQAQSRAGSPPAPSTSASCRSPSLLPAPPRAAVPARRRGACLVPHPARPPARKEPSAAGAPCPDLSHWGLGGQRWTLARGRRASPSLRGAGKCKRAHRPPPQEPVNKDPFVRSCSLSLSRRPESRGCGVGERGGDRSGQVPST